MLRRLCLSLALMGGIVFLGTGVADAQSKGSSKPPSSSGSSGGSSSGSGGKFGSPGSNSNQKPPVSGGTTGGKFGSPGASGDKDKDKKPAAPPPASGDKGKFGSPGASGGGGDKPKFGSPSGGNTNPTPPPGSSRKPGTNSNDEKAKANREQASKRVYEEQTKAVAPPKPSYKAPDGKEVKIDPKAASVDQIRSRPSRDLDPEVRYNYTVKHVHHYHYSHPYSYYTAQPVFYVGGGYSSAFWWMMMEWSAERRAMWFYNNRYNIDSAAYERGLQDGEVRARIAALERQNMARNTSYIDPEFNDNPTLMYDQDYVESCYNPNVRTVNYSSPGGGGVAWSILGWICLGLVVLIGGIFLFNVIFVKRYGN
jgi:hypothetical protein